MSAAEFLSRLTPSSEILAPDETCVIASFFTNPDRSVVALKNLPEVVKGALFSRYSRSTKGVRRLFLDEFWGRHNLNIETFTGTPHSRTGEVHAADFYRRVLSDFGDDSIGELGGAHLAFQEISQVAAKAIEDNRIGLSFLEKSSRYVPFDDRVNGWFRYYRPSRIMDSQHGTEFAAKMDQLFEAYGRHLPALIAHLMQTYPIETMEFEIPALEGGARGEPARFSEIRDDDFRHSAQIAYRQAVQARARDALRSFLPLATLTNVGVWGNGRALEYLLVKLHAAPLEEVQTLAHAAQYELDQVIGAFVKRANDDKGKAHQAFLRDQRARQHELARQYLPARVEPTNTATAQPVILSEAKNHVVGETRLPSASLRAGFAPLRVTRWAELPTNAKVTLVRYDEDAVDRVVAAILYPASDLPKTEILAMARELRDEDKARILRDYVGTRHNRRHKPGRAFEHAMYEFDLVLNIGEYRDLQRHRIVTPDRQMFTTRLGYEINDDIAVVAEVRADYARCMDQVAELYETLADEMPFEAQYVVPFGFRVRYNVQLNLREAYHWIELRSSPQGHPDYRRTSQEMFRAIQAVHPLLVEAMTFADLTPDVPIGRLRAEMRRARKGETFAKSSAEDKSTNPSQAGTM
jgi:thymidylate synthase ThyX